MVSSRLMTLVLSLILVIALGYLLTVGRSVLIPIVTAVISVYIITTATSALQHLPGFRHMPTALLRIAVLVLFALLLYIFAVVVASTVADIALVAPDYQRNIEELLVRFETRFGIDTQTTLDDVAAATFGSLSLQAAILAVLGGFTSIGATAFLVVIYVAFLMSERATFGPKVIAAFHDEDRARDILDIVAEINRQIGEYLTVKTLVNIILGTACLVIFLVMGTDFALFWAIVIGLVNYIPYLGSWIGVMFPVALSIAQTGSILYTVVLAGLLTAAQVVVGNFIEPRMIGRQLNLSPFVVLVSLSIWSALWGVAGAILAVPMTSIVVIILTRFPETQFIAALLAERIDSGPATDAEAGPKQTAQSAADR